MNIPQLPAPNRTPGPETNWTEWDAVDQWLTVAVTENDNVALIDNDDPDQAAFLAPEEAEDLAYALLAAAQDADARIKRALAAEKDADARTDSREEEQQ